MVTVRIEEKSAFAVCGARVAITGQDNEQFARFWAQCNQNGVTEALKRASADPAANVTGSRIMGVSRTEKDPENRAFDFYIACESKGVPGFDAFTVEGGLWAIFTPDGRDAGALIEAEMEAFMRWLPASGYRHDHRPELEVYPEREGAYVEFWLPIR